MYMAVLWEEQVGDRQQQQSEKERKSEQNPEFINQCFKSGGVFSESRIQWRCTRQCV